MTKTTQLQPRDQGRIAAIELGGTKTIALLWQDGMVVEEARWPTTNPEALFADIMPTVQRWWADARFDAIGIGTFGPASLDQSAPDYGHIRTTPKAEWTGAAIVPRFAAHFDCPLAIDTDVNAAAMAEQRWGAGRNAATLIYVTIGTGLGAGVLVEGRPMHGRLHPEMGHILLRRGAGDMFGGACPFHGDCAEGLLAGPALAARFGVAAQNVPLGDPRWEQPSADLAQFLAVLIHGFAPNRLLIGGGVGMGAGGMLARAKTLLPSLLAGYYPDLDEAAIDALITQPMLGDRAGPLGAVAVGLAGIGR